MMLAVMLMATYAYAISPGEFHEKWSKNHVRTEDYKRVDMIRYIVWSYHTYHWRITTLKARPNHMPGSAAWVIRRIVHPKPDAIMITLRMQGSSHPLMAMNRELACVEFRKGVPVVVWKSDDMDNKIVDVLLRAEGYCPIGGAT